MSTSFKTLVLASSMVVWAAAEASAAEYQCRKSDSTLRIAVEVKKAGHTLPCEVIAEDDRGERAVLFSAQFDREYCPARIEKTKAELEQEGWSCEQTSDVNVVRKDGVSEGDNDPETLAQNEQAAPDVATSTVAEGREITASRQCRLGDEVRQIHIEVEDVASGTPCELLYWADGDQSKPGQLLWRAEHDATFCPRRLDKIVGKWVEDGWQCGADGIETAAVDTTSIVDEEPETEPVQEVAETESEIDPPQSDRVLEAIVAADAERISEWMEVEPAIEIAARGDLNDDGNDDAVVFLAYQSGQAAYRQYLMSYLVADDGYELASVKLLTGVNSQPDQARVEEIEEGVIWLTLPSEDGSSTGQTGYKLRDQQLVEVEPGSELANN